MDIQKRNLGDKSEDRMSGDRRFPQNPRRLWIFLILGIVTIIAGIVISALYFNIQAVTSSQNHTEILPTYIVSLVVVLCGALVIVLFWKRPLVLVFFGVVSCIGTGGLCGVIAILTLTHILQPITSLYSCYYNSQTCVCTSPYKKNLLQLETVTTQYAFEKTENCTSVTSFLPSLLYALCGLYFVVFLLCALSSIFAFLVFRVERSKFNGYQEETYEEIFTISGSSSTVTENNDDLNVMEKDTTSIVALSQIGSCRGTTGSCKVSSGSCRGGDTSNLARSGILKPFDKQENNNFINSSRLSRSGDSIDAIYAHTKEQCVEEVNNGWGIPVKGTSKLKEHRKKDRRAVTLHNLDTKQLMLILSLQMRYLEETKKLQSQGNLNNAGNSSDIPLARRAMTPQPYHQKRNQSTTLPRQLKAKTPQPEDFQSERNYTSELDPVYGIPITSSKVKQREVRDIEAFENLVQASRHSASEKFHNNQNMDCFEKHLNQKAKNKKKESESLKLMQNQNSNDTVSANELPDFAPKSKSRTSVQHYFLPPEPVHRGKSALPPQPIHREITMPPTPQHRHNADKSKLPPQPIRRRAEQNQNLPREPLHRNGSAFQMVGKSVNNSDKTVDNSNQLGPIYGRSAMSHDSVLTNPGEFYYQQAIRDNFRLRANPFMLQNNTPTHSVHASELTFQSEPPPPYAPPPTYRDFLSISQDGSVLSDSQDETTDQESVDFANNIQNMNNGQNGNILPGNHLQDRETIMSSCQTSACLNQQSAFSASDDDVFLSGNVGPSQNVTPVYSQVVKRQKMQPPYNFNHANMHHQNQGLYINSYNNSNTQEVKGRQGHNYEEIDDLDINYTYNDDSSFGVSSESSLIPAGQMTSNNRGKHYMNGNVDDDPDVLETMI